MERKLFPLTSILAAFITTAAAHEEGYHMINGWHGTMWGGGLFMLALWILVILAIIYLVQKIIQNSQLGEEK